MALDCGGGEVCSATKCVGDKECTATRAKGQIYRKKRKKNLKKWGGKTEKVGKFKTTSQKPKNHTKLDRKTRARRKEGDTKITSIISLTQRASTTAVPSQDFHQRLEYKKWSADEKQKKEKDLQIEMKVRELRKLRNRSRRN